MEIDIKAAEKLFREPVYNRIPIKNITIPDIINFCLFFLELF